MLTVNYKVQTAGGGSFQVQGEIKGCRGIVKMVAQERYGEVTDVHAAFQNVHFFTGTKLLACLRPRPWEWQVEARDDPISFAYEVRLGPDNQAISSFIRGYSREDLTFFLGMALFLGVADDNVHYRLRFGQTTHGTCHKSRGDFLCRSRRELYLSAFIQGRFEKSEARVSGRRLILVREKAPGLEVEPLIPPLKAMLSRLTDLFGGAAFTHVTFFLLAHQGVEFDRDMGMGLSVHGGIVLSFPRAAARLDLPQHLWLALHEFLHQWLGLALQAGEVGLEWFFEGFTSFFTLSLLKQEGWISDQYHEKITQINRDAYLSAARKLVLPGPDNLTALDEFQYGFHGGFFLAWLWDMDLKIANRGGLADLIRRFYQQYRGQVLTAASLLFALEASCPDGQLPPYFHDFLRREGILPVDRCLGD